MKLKTSIILAMFMATAIFSTSPRQNQDSLKRPQTQQNQQVSNQQQQNQQDANTRGITGGSRTNWSKIKDMFM